MIHSIHLFLDHSLQLTSICNKKMKKMIEAMRSIPFSHKIASSNSHKESPTQNHQKQQQCQHSICQQLEGNCQDCSHSVLFDKSVQHIKPDNFFETQNLKVNQCQGKLKEQGEKVKYVGRMKDHKFEGRGRLENEACIYEGMFKNGLFHGYGVKKQRSGALLKGLFVEGKFSQGVIQYPDGKAEPYFRKCLESNE